MDVNGQSRVEGKNIENVSIYPNPFNNEFFIKSSTAINTAILTDALGKLVLHKKYNNTGINSIQIENLFNGLYFLELKTGVNKSEIIKVAKN